MSGFVCSPVPSHLSSTGWHNVPPILGIVVVGRRGHSPVTNRGHTAKDGRPGRVRGQCSGLGSTEAGGVGGVGRRLGVDWGSSAEKIKPLKPVPQTVSGRATLPRGRCSLPMRMLMWEKMSETRSRQVASAPCHRQAGRKRVRPGCPTAAPATATPPAPP